MTTDWENNPLMNPPTFVSAIETRGEATPSGATSPAGARSQMQVLPSTAAKPGFGVAPAANDSFAEYNRVGKDLATALLRYYNSPALAAAAYNAGSGNVNKWLTEFGDPRNGGISLTDWLAKIPFAETRAYVQRVLGSEALSAPKGGEPQGPGVPGLGAGSGLPLTSPQESTQLAGLAQKAAGASGPGEKLKSILGLMGLAKSLGSQWHPVQVDYDPFKGVGI